HLDLGLAALQRPLQLLPDEWFRQQILDLYDKITAIGPQQAARLDPREVGDDASEPVDHPVDRAEQVAVVGRRLEHDRGVGRLAVVDQQVDLVLEEPLLDVALYWLADERFQLLKLQP